MVNTNINVSPLQTSTSGPYKHQHQANANINVSPLQRSTPDQHKDQHQANKLKARPTHMSTSGQIKTRPTQMSTLGQHKLYVSAIVFDTVQLYLIQYNTLQFSCTGNALYQIQLYCIA